MPIVAIPPVDRLPIKPSDLIAHRTADADSDGQGLLVGLQRHDESTAVAPAGSQSSRSRLARPQSEHGGWLSARGNGSRSRAFGRSMLSACLVIVIAATAVHASDEPAANPQNAFTPSDPWSDYIAEAAERFAIPERLIRAVIRAESAGDVHAVSPKGAMGLMQIMPATWTELRARYDLGDDPFLPRDNIMAGAAYLREMLDRFGPDGFLAAYNAGPARYEDHLLTGRPPPAETVAYVSKFVPIVFGKAYPSSSQRQLADTNDALHSPLFLQSGGISENGPLQEKRGTSNGVFVPLRPAASPSRQATISDPPARPSVPEASSDDSSLPSTLAASSLFVSRSSAAPR